MWIKKLKSSDSAKRDYDRESFRSSVVSLFWNLIAFRRNETGLTFSELAENIGVHKSAPSRWFGGEKPNWEANTMADIANALGVELEIYARDVRTGQRFAPFGPIVPVKAVETSTSSEPVSRNPGYPEGQSRHSRSNNRLEYEVAA